MKDFPGPGFEPATLEIYPHGHRPPLKQKAVALCELK